jgi:hypothetical protein
MRYRIMPAILRLEKCSLIWRFALGAIVCGLPAAGRACDTPVYRYALYHWTATPYHVVYFKQGKPGASDEEIARLVGKLGEGDAAANLVLDTFDLAHDKIDEMPEPIQAAWKARKDAKPAYLVLTPQGTEVFAGRLEVSMLRSMTDSPARHKLCQQLDDGKAVVFLLVPGKDPVDNGRARKAVEELIAQTGVAAQGTPRAPREGEGTPHAPREGVRPAERDEHNEQKAGASIPAAVSPGGHAGQQESGEGLAAPTIPIRLGLIEVSRSDPAERWLIRAMMSVEPDLAGLADQPMVFAVYGRARVLEPYVGKGITVDNLSQLVEFVTGACSCQVKDANPGMDLLTAWNWDATAERLAAKDSSFGPAVGGYAEIGPKDPSAPAGDSKASAEVGKRDPASRTAGQASSGTQTPPVPSAGKAKLVRSARQTPESPVHVKVIASGHLDPPPPFANRLAWRLGLGLLAGAVIVLAAGFVLVRHRGPV